MGADFNHLKVISPGEEYDWKRVPVSGDHWNKRVGENARSIVSQFDSEGVLSVKKPGVSEQRGL